MNALIDKEFEKLTVFIKPKDIVNLGFSKTTVYCWFNSYDFPAIRHGRSLKAPKDKVYIWLKERGIII